MTQPQQPIARDWIENAKVALKEFNNNDNKFQKKVISRTEVMNALNTEIKPIQDFLHEYLYEKYLETDQGKEDINSKDVLMKDFSALGSKEPSSKEFRNFVKEQYKSDKTYKSLVEIFKVAIAKKRIEVLDFNDHRSLVTNVGANNTVYNIGMNDKEILESNNIEEILKSVQSLTLQRVAGNGKKDGVGAPGGAWEMIDEKDFNPDDDISKYLEYDNVVKGTEGKLRLLIYPEDRLEIAKNAALREAREELGDDLDTEVYEAYTNMISGVKANIAIGHSDKPVTDQAFILNKYGIDSFNDSFVADPVCFETKVDQEKFQNFKQAYENAFNDKLKNQGKEKTEVGGLRFDSLFDNLAKYGYDEKGKCINLKSDKFLDGNAYRYPHEYAVNLKILNDIAVKKYPDDKNKQQDMIVEAMTLVQKKINNNDQFKGDDSYSIDLEKIAKTMFPAKEQDAKKLLEESAGFSEGTIEKIQESIKKENNKVKEPVAKNDQGTIKNNGKKEELVAKVPTVRNYMRPTTASRNKKIVNSNNKKENPLMSLVKNTTAIQYILDKGPKGPKGHTAYNTQDEVKKR